METVVPPSFTTVYPSLTACVIMSYKLCNCVLRLMEMVSKQSSNLQDCAGDCAGAVLRQTVLPIYGTACAIVSYCLCNCVLLLVEMVSKQSSNLQDCAEAVLRQTVLSIYGTACATMSYKLCNCVLRLMEMVSKQFSHLWKRFQKWYERKSAVT